MNTDAEPFEQRPVIKFQPIGCDVILESVRTRRDNSLGLSFSTPELSNEAMLVFLRLRGINLRMALQPLQVTAEPPLEIKSEFKAKTPSQRLRSVMFVLWETERASGAIPDNESFEVFYANKMEKIIEWLKGKLPDS